MLQQQPPSGSSFTAASSSEATHLTCRDLWDRGRDTVGQLTADGDPTNVSPGKITAGTLDINNFGALLGGAGECRHVRCLDCDDRPHQQCLSLPTGGTPHGFVRAGIRLRRQKRAEIVNV